MSKNKEILVTRSSLPSFGEYCEEIAPLWESHLLTNQGVKHKQLEAEIQNYLDVKQATLFVNGHSALECILESFDLGGDGRNEVITTPFTFASTTHAIVRKGLTPVFCDICESDYTIDASKIEALITDKTCAILPVHVYGNICDVDAIQETANRHDLKVIYDAAHAFGIKLDGVGIGNFGDASMFSFHATKVFHTIEGGAIVHSNVLLAERLSQWRNFGITGPDTCEYIGGNSKMNEFAASMGICNLRHIDEEIAKRKAVAERYWDNIRGVPGLRICEPPTNVDYNYAYLPIVIDQEIFGASRDDVVTALAGINVGARKYFYPLTSDFKCYETYFEPSVKATPIAHKIAQQVITLPLYADLALNDVNRICATMFESGKRLR